MSRYRGKRSPEGLASWFSLMMGELFFRVSFDVPAAAVASVDDGDA